MCRRRARRGIERTRARAHWCCRPNARACATARTGRVAAGAPSSGSDRRRWRSACPACRRGTGAVDRVLVGVDEIDRRAGECGECAVSVTCAPPAVALPRLATSARACSARGGDARRILQCHPDAGRGAGRRARRRSDRRAAARTGDDEAQSRRRGTDRPRCRCRSSPPAAGVGARGAPAAAVELQSPGPRPAACRCRRRSHERGGAGIGLHGGHARRGKRENAAPGLPL